MQRELELAATIGMSASYPDCSRLHLDEQHLIYPLGGTLVVRNMASGSQKFLQGHDNTICAMDLSPSGTYLATAQVTFPSFVADVVVWNLNDFQVLRRFKLHKTACTSLAFSCDERHLFTAGGPDDNSIVVWNLQEGKAIMSARTEPLSRVAAFHKDPLRFVSTHTSGQIKLWTVDLKLKKLQITPASTGHLKRQFSTLLIDSTDTFVYAGTRSGDFMEIQIDTATFTRVGPLKQMVGAGIRTMVYHEASGNFLIGGGDGCVYVVPRKDFLILQIAKFGQAIASISPGTKEAWITTSNSTLFRQADLRFKAPPEVVLSSHPERINKVAFPAGFAEVFATCSVNDIRVWNSKTRRQLLRIQVAGHECLCVRFMRDGKSLVSGWNDGKIRAFLPQSGKLFYTISEAHKGQVTAIAGLGDSKKLVSGGVEGEIRIWRIGKQTQMLDASIKEHRGSVNAINLSEKGARGVSCASDGTCVVWDMESYSKIVMFREDNNFQDARFSQDEAFVLTSGTNGIITFWNWTKGKAVRRINGAEQEQTIVAVDTDPTGEYLVTGGDEKIVKVWSCEGAELVAEGVAHFGRISDVQISPNNAFIVSAGTEGAIMVWRVPPEYQAERAPSEYGSPKKKKS